MGKHENIQEDEKSASINWWNLQDIGLIWSVVGNIRQGIQNIRHRGQSLLLNQIFKMWTIFLSLIWSDDLLAAHSRHKCYLLTDIDMFWGRCSTWCRYIFPLTNMNVVADDQWSVLNISNHSPLKWPRWELKNNFLSVCSSTFEQWNGLWCLDYTICGEYTATNGELFSLYSTNFHSSLLSNI